ncbi:unnamed protein product [Polarella glacialis]|uniref:Uncharacterized protein n=1 Tax=Polarella glacialis TaxID=89957 RepID=A0A813FRJ6_POLGL|nr:unnamed protein product [Polarella glacialis]
MPIDNELTMRLEQRRSDLSRSKEADVLANGEDSDLGPDRSPTPCRGVPAASTFPSKRSVVITNGGDFKSTIDQELIAKLQKRQSTILHQEREGGDVAGPSAPSAAGEVVQASGRSHIDSELMEKLQKRQTRSVQDMETSGRASSCCGLEIHQLRPKWLADWICFQAPIDGELAEKLRRRDGSNFHFSISPDLEEFQYVLLVQAWDAIMAAARGGQDDADELVRKLARRRNVVEAGGDHFQKDRDGGLIVRKADMSKVSQAGEDAAAECTACAVEENSSPGPSSRRSAYWIWLLFFVVVPAIIAFFAADFNLSGFMAGLGGRF